MEYVFGKKLYNNQETEFVKTISDDKVEDLPNGRFVTYVYDNGSITITHNFRILWKYKENQDLQGKYQTWYYIDNHTITSDFLKPINKQLSTQSLQLRDQSEIIDDILIDLLGE